MERTRLEAFLLNLRSERMQLQNDLADGLGELCLLMGGAVRNEYRNGTSERNVGQDRFSAGDAGSAGIFFEPASGPESLRVAGVALRG